VKYYVLSIEGGINPELVGPYDNEEHRDADGKAIHDDQDPDTDATFALDIDTDGTAEIYNCDFDFMQ